MNDIVFAVILVSAIGIVAGIGLAVASIVMGIKTDERITRVREELPGANCGACGFSGCDGYAAAIVNGDAKLNLCSVGGAEVTKKISAIMGKDAEFAAPKTAVVMCTGNNAAASKKMDYLGISSCKAAAQLFGGAQACRFGCLGLGDCVKACEYGALHICNGVAVVNSDACRACGVCTTVCPKQIIKLTELCAKPIVLCSNTDNGAQTKKVCKNGCLGCKLCAKQCEHEAISFDNGKAVIDREKCENCGKCAGACKFGVIKSIMGRK